MNKTRRKRSSDGGSKNRRPLWHFVVIGFLTVTGIILALLIIPWALAIIPGGGGGGGQTTTQPGTIETLQWDIFTNDLFAGGVADSSVAIYNPETHLVIESGETGSDGKWTSTGYFTSDDLYDFKFGNGTFVEYWVLGVAVPRFQGTVLSGATHKSTFNVVDQGTFSLAIAWGASRTAISSGGDYNQTTSGGTPTFYFTVRNTEAESGFLSSHNPILDMDCNAVLEVYATGTNYQNVGWTNTYEDKNDGAKQSWFVPLQDTDITYDLDADGNEILDGQRTFSAAFDFSAVNGDAVDIYIRLILGTSIDYLQSHAGLPSSSYAYTYTTSAYFNLLD